MSAIPELDTDEVRLLVNATRLADGYGPVVCVKADQTGGLVAAELGSEPCVVIGVDVVAQNQSERSAIESTVFRSPLAAIALCVLLRGGLVDSRDVRIARESAVYSLLQAGPEFAQWQAGRPLRKSTEHSVDSVLVERFHDELMITLNRPAHGNAVNRALRDGLCEAIAVAALDRGIDTVTLRANGPNFCTGGDLDEFGTFPDPAASHVLRLQRSPARMLARIGNRLCTYVHGTCAGSGIELAAFSHRVVAHPATTFVLPELSLGLVPGAGGTVSIVDRIGAQRTAWLLLTGWSINADTALSWGLIDEIDG